MELRDTLFENRTKLLTKEGKKPTYFVKRSTWNKANWPTFLRVIKSFSKPDVISIDSAADLEFLKDKNEMQKLLDFVNSEKYINKFGKAYSRSQKVTHLAQIASVLSALSYDDEAWTPLWKMASNQACELRSKQRTEDSKNELSEKEKKHLQPWSVYEEAFDKIDDLKAKSVIGLFTKIDPRRSSILELTLGPLKKTQNVDQNELRLRESVIILRKYKTSKFYGENTIKLPPDLVKILKKYVKNFDIRKGELLFPITNTSVLVKQAFKKAGLPHVTANLLRHSRISQLYKANSSVFEKEELAKKMGHSVEIQSFYNKIYPSSEEKKEADASDSS